jgi:hypothetical protein
MKGNNLKTLLKHERGFPISLLRYEGHDSPNDHTDYNLSEANYLGSFHSPSTQRCEREKDFEGDDEVTHKYKELMRLNAKTRPVGQEQRNPIGGPQRFARTAPAPAITISGCATYFKSKASTQQCLQSSCPNTILSFEYIHCLSIL